MRTQDFESLPLEKKLSLIQERGKLLDTTIRGGYSILLYWTENLILEVFKNPSGQIVSVKCFDKEFYLMQTRMQYAS